MPNLADLAPNLTQAFPRSPRVALGGYVIAARALDKCRASLNGSNGEYHFDCPLDNQFFGFAQLEASSFQQFVATGATDEEVASWIETNAKPTRQEVIAWNNKMRSLRVADLPMEAQEFLEDYIPANLPPEKPVYVWFDVYDIEEERL